MHSVESLAVIGKAVLKGFAENSAVDGGVVVARLFMAVIIMAARR
ncbi:MAG: hypothetical protein WA624_06380 [Methylocella sp.]